MAFDSHSTKSPSRSVGMRILGLRAAYSGVLCSPLSRSTMRSVKASPRWLATAITLKARGLGGKTKGSIVMEYSLWLPDLCTHREALHRRTASFDFAQDEVKR